MALWNNGKVSGQALGSPEAFPRAPRVSGAIFVCPEGQRPFSFPLRTGCLLALMVS